MLHPTHQARSRESLERLLIATETLLARGRTLEDLKVAEIAAEAGLSVGAFYARFKNKASLLPLLQTRYGEQVRTLAPVYFAPERWAGHDLAGRVPSCGKSMARKGRQASPSPCVIVHCCMRAKSV